MKYLIVNIGSSSIKLDIVESKSQQITNSFFSYHHNLIETELKKLIKKIPKVDKIIHRVVHSGPKVLEFAKLSKDIKQQIKDASELAPLHNPADLIGIETLEQELKLETFVVFDTGFFKNLEDQVTTPAIPKELREKYSIKKYGFHGIAHSYLYNTAIKKLNLSKKTSNIITVQLGNGCSVCLIQNGEPKDTSMDYTPLSGLIMGTRVGDLDPGITEKLAKTEPNLSDILNKESGLLALSQNYSNMKDIIEKKDTDPNCKLAYEAFIYRVAKYISSYAGFTPNLNAVVFGGGISFNAPKVTYDIMNLLKGVTPASHLIEETRESIEMVRIIENQN